MRFFTAGTLEITSSPTKRSVCRRSGAMKRGRRSTRDTSAAANRSMAASERWNPSAAARRAGLWASCAASGCSVHGWTTMSGLSARMMSPLAVPSPLVANPLM